MIPDEGEPAEITPAHAELEAALTAVVRWASRASVVRQLAGPAAAGLSPTDLWLLDGIVRHGPVRASDIATWQGVDRSTMTAQLRRLTGRGLVDRDPDPRDARAVLVSSSAAGRRLHDEVRRQGARVLADLLADWAPADREAFAGLLSRFAARLGPGPAPR
ncbi:MarR family winged helix-turn-helix transcriptional regulator [Modestobacter sp. I12A-02662]|uniref:MarR family winged helix-turn-helix transcriptional regulator n=1 Tax=Modestobacter sp. I12A-02662 TaxID=1730496 RepID=UPI0034DF3760